MSTAAQAELPSELKPSTWEKNKGCGFDAKSDVVDKLEALQKKHEAVDWKLFDAAWPQSAKSAAELQQAFAKRDQLYRGSVLALKKDTLALAGIAKAEQKKAAKPWLETLKTIAKAADAYADALERGAEALKAIFAKAQAALPDDDDNDDDDSSPTALVDPKLLYRQLTLCRNKPDSRMNFAFVDAKDKDHPAVMALHARNSGRTLSAKLQAATGVKTGAHGTAWVDGSDLMLQLDKPLSGLVKKLRPLVKATGFKIARVVLWNADGTVFEQDTGQAEGTAAQDTAQEAASDTQQHTYQARRDALWPRLEAALRAGPDGAASKLRAVAGFADGKAEVGQYPAAMKALDALQGLLSAATAAAPADKPQGLVAFTHTRLAWDEARKTVRAELHKLEAQILVVCESEADFAQIQTGTKNLYEMLEVLDERLIDKLDEALNAAAPEQRRQLHLQAREIVDAYIEFVDSEPLIGDIDDNGFIDVAVRSTLTTTLSDMAGKLAAWH